MNEKDQKAHDDTVAGENKAREELAKTQQAERAVARAAEKGKGEEQVITADDVGTIDA